MSGSMMDPLRGSISREKSQMARTHRAAASVIESLEDRLLLSTTQINPGFAMGSMQADPSRDLVYILDQTNDRVLAIDTGLARTVSFADVGGSPTAMAISLDAKELYVAASSDDRIEVYSLPELLPLRTLEVPAPGNFTVGAGNRLYVAGTGTWDAMRQVDANTGRVLRSFGRFYAPLPVTDSTGTRLFVSELYLSTTDTDEYDIADPTKTPQITRLWDTHMANGSDFAIDEEYGRLYSMSGGVYGVWVVDQATGTPSPWSFGRAAYGGSVTLTAGQPYVWATSRDPYNGGVFQFDRETGAVVNSYKPTRGYASTSGVEATPNGRVIYTTDPTYGALELGIIGSSTLTLTGIPLARFNWKADPFPSLKVSFDATVSRDWDVNGSITKWAWDFGDGATGSGAKIEHTFTTFRWHTVTLTVTDNQGNKDEYLVKLNLSNRPDAESLTVTLNEDSSKTFLVQGIDPDGDELSFIIQKLPAHGKLQQNGASMTYTPDPDFFGSDSLIFVASDGAHESAPATISFTVDNVADAPIANDDAVPIAAGTQTVILPVLNDLDLDGESLNITSFTQPSAGSVVSAGDYFLYTPASPGSSTADSFSYTIQDPSGLTSTATVYIAPGYANVSGEWNTYGNSTAHAGYFAGTLANGIPVANWSLPAGSSNSGPIAVGGERVYITDWQPDGYFLKALSPATGATLWTHRFEPAGSLNPPTYFNGVVYLQRGNHNYDTQLWAIDAATGATIWSEPFSAQWQEYYAPAVSSEGIWINGGAYGGMYGFDRDGTPIKFVSLAQYDRWTPSILGENIYSYVAGIFTKYDKSGNYIWSNTKSWDWAGWSMNRVSALAGGQAFLIGNPDLYSVNLSTGETVWTVPGYFAGTPAANAGVVFALQGTEVKSYSASTGASVQTYTADQHLREQPIVTDDVVIAASSEKTYIFSRSSGELLHTLSFGGSIALSNNRLYISSEDGSIHTFLFAAQAALALVAGGPYTVEEGQSITLSPLVTPPAGISVTSYEIDWDYDGVNFTADATSTSATFSAADITAPTTRTIALRAHFSTGDISNVSAASLTVVDLAPTATFSAPSSVDEGSSASVEFTNVSGVPGGFVYSYDLDSDGTFDIVKTSSPTASIPASLLDVGPGQLTVTARIYDQDQRFRQYQKTITINNVAPTATFSNGGAVNEGSTAIVSFNSAADPSTADTVIGFLYSYDFNNDREFEIINSPVASATVPARYLKDGPGSRTIAGRIADISGGFSDYQTTIVINNVAPTALLFSSGPVKENSFGTLRFSSTFDPSAADTEAGFRYSYDLNNDGDYGDNGEARNVSASTWRYTFPDDGTYTVAARITDRDGGSRVYTTTVIVTNVPPTAFIWVAGKKIHKRKASAFLFSATDVSPTDQKSPFNFSVDWNGDGKIDEVLQSASSTLIAKHVFTRKGNYTIKLFATDKDGQTGPAALLSVRVV
jgi:outer membrane protein assembly factor BamB